MSPDEKALPHVCSTILDRAERNYNETMQAIRARNLDDAEIGYTQVWEDGNLLDELRCPHTTVFRARGMLFEVKRELEFLSSMKYKERTSKFLPKMVV